MSWRPTTKNVLWDYGELYVRVVWNTEPSFAEREAEKERLQEAALGRNYQIVGWTDGKVSSYGNDFYLRGKLAVY